MSDVANIAAGLDSGVAERVLHVLSVAANFTDAEARGGEFSEQYRADLASMNGDIIADDIAALRANLLSEQSND